MMYDSTRQIMVELQQLSPQSEQQPERSFRPKLGLLAAALALGVLPFVTLFSVELAALQLNNLTPPVDDEVKQQQKQQHTNTHKLPLISKAKQKNGWEIKPNYTVDVDDDDDVDNNSKYDDDRDNNTTTSQHDNNNNNNNSDLQLQISKGYIANSFPVDQINQAILRRNQDFHENQRAHHLPSSPACYPHFNLCQQQPKNNGQQQQQQQQQWNNTTKFKRILFYHARKAGGSSMNRYLVKVAQTYGIKIEWIEWSAMEEPGTKKEEDTFYVTHLREPIDRSISHFKYNGRWPCKTMVGNNKAFIPTEDNANKLETWNQTSGHERISCRNQRTDTIFQMGDCAVNCYTQWFGGLNCPRWQVPIEQQYEVAMSKLLKYNLVVVIEKLRDPNYVRAIENFFGVGGVLERGTPYCERQSHKANENNPLVIHNETRARLASLNRVDLKLYHEISDCLADGNYDHIPKWDGDRFMLNSYNFTQAKIDRQKAKALKAMRNG